MNKIWKPCVIAIGTACIAIAAPAAAFECNEQVNRSASPYNLDKFKSVIDNSERLQVQTSSTCLSRSEMQNYKIDPQNWHLDDRNMYFGFWNGKDGERTELRGSQFAGTATNKKFDGKIKVRRDSKTSKQYTVAQIFSDYHSKPIVRVEFIDSKDNKTNWLWAVYRKGTAASGDTIYKPLGPAQTSFVPLLMTYNNGSHISVTYNGTTVWFGANFSFWEQSNKPVYFKAGCYLQEDGDCEVRYSSLHFDK